MTDSGTPEEGACTRKATHATNLLPPGFTLSRAVMNPIFQPPCRIHLGDAPQWSEEWGPLQPARDNLRTYARVSIE